MLESALAIACLIDSVGYFVRFASSRGSRTRASSSAASKPRNTFLQFEPHTSYTHVGHSEEIQMQTDETVKAIKAILGRADAHQLRRMLAMLELPEAKIISLFESTYEKPAKVKRPGGARASLVARV